MMTKLPLHSKQGKPFKVRHWFLPLAFVLILAGLFALNATHNAPLLHAASPSTKIWLQVMDSCKEALPGANFTLITPDGTKVNAGPSAGTKRMTVSSGSCPLPRGNCQAVPTGCVSWLITPPASGVATYTIQEYSTWDATDGFHENPKGATAFTGFVPCNGGSACQKESATFTVNANGVVSGTTTNIYPDGKSSMYPSSGTFSGTQKDPIVFHNSQLGKGSCDGDQDTNENDHLTGAPSSHCADNTKSEPHPTATPQPNTSATPVVSPTSTLPTDVPGLPATGSDPNQ